MNEQFKKWWDEEGSGMRPKKSEDLEEFMKRITEIAWSNGEYCATNQALKGDE